MLEEKKTDKAKIKLRKKDVMRLTFREYRL